MYKQPKRTTLLLTFIKRKAKQKLSIHGKTKVKLILMKKVEVFDDIVLFL